MIYEINKIIVYIINKLIIKGVLNMEINIKKNKEIKLGDIVEYEGELHLVVYDENSNFCYRIVRLIDFKIVNAWRNLDMLSHSCKLVEKSENLKLEVI